MRSRDAYDALNHVNKISDFPTKEHLAIITFDTIHIPADQRSIDCPGHGYPATTEPVMRYVWYDLQDREFWEEEILCLMTNKKQFIALDRGVRYEPKLGLV